jgi:RNA polymerase sigma factor (sigma-70 family)
LFSNKCPETEEFILFKRYFKKKDPNCETTNTEWIEMTGLEYYQFMQSPDSKGRFFIDMGDSVLECSIQDFRQYKAEQNHKEYLRKHQEGWITLSLYADEVENGYNGEELIEDDTQNVENNAIHTMEVDALQAALSHLDSKSYRLIYALYLADQKKSERELAAEYGVSQNAIHKQKKKILKKLEQMLIQFLKDGNSQ